MNQKQKDLLCGMLDRRVHNLKLQIDRHFKDQEPGALYESDMLREDCPRLDNDNLPKDIVTQAEQVRSAVDKLSIKWKALMRRVGREQEQHKFRVQRVQNKLSSIQEKLTVRIQFAEDAEQAEAFLDGLPSFESLIK